jgi:protein TonB
MLKEDAPPAASQCRRCGYGHGRGNGAPGGVLGRHGLGTAGPTITVAKPKPTGPARISGGVIAGNILTKTIPPVYPPYRQGGACGRHCGAARHYLQDRQH